MIGVGLFGFSRLRHNTAVPRSTEGRRDWDFDAKAIPLGLELTRVKLNRAGIGPYAGRGPGAASDRPALEAIAPRLVAQSSVVATEPPADLAGQARDAALDLINFFKGLSALSDPNGSH